MKKLKNALWNKVTYLWSKSDEVLNIPLRRVVSNLVQDDEDAMAKGYLIDKFPLDILTDISTETLKSSKSQLTKRALKIYNHSIKML